MAGDDKSEFDGNKKLKDLESLVEHLLNHHPGPREQ